MGAEMDAALSAYDDAAMALLLLVGAAWLAIGALIMRNEEADDGH